MRHLLARSATLLVTALVGTAPACAQYYAAVPAKQPTRTTLVTRETPWSLKGDAYVAARAPERDATLCDALARSAGVLSSFTVAGKPYDADALAKCNVHAKGGAIAAGTVAAR